MRFILVILIGIAIGWWLRGESIESIEIPTVVISPEEVIPQGNANPNVVEKSITQLDRQLPVQEKKSVLEQLASLYEQYYLVGGDTSTSQVKMKIDELVDSRTAALKRANRNNELVQLMEFLLVQDSGNAAYYYDLAQAQYNLRLNLEALSSLSSILYDPVFGEQAQALTNKIERQLQLARKVRVPLERIGEHYILTAQIASQGTVRLLIDTGASITTLSPQAIQRLGLQNLDQQRVIHMNTAGGQIQAPVLNVSNIAVMNMQVENLEVGVVSLSGLKNIDGLLGMNYLRNFEFNLDQTENVLYLDGRN